MNSPIYIKRGKSKIIEKKESLYHSIKIKSSKTEILVQVESIKSIGQYFDSNISTQKKVYFIILPVI